MATRRASGRHHTKTAAAAVKVVSCPADADDLEQDHVDQPLRLRKGQARKRDEEPDVGCEEGLDEQHEPETSDDAEGDVGPSSTAARARSHANAGPGPRSMTATAGGNRKQHKASSNKRPAAAAFQDAISLLPDDLDVAMLVRARQQLVPRNRNQKQALLQSYRQQFQHWRFLLRQRFSLLFYGFGSKCAMLELFADEALTDGGVLACDGLAPGVTSKQVLQAVASALTHRSCKNHSHTELMSLISGEPPCRQLYVLLHNIDGPGLRSGEEQLWLSRLSQAPAVRLVASVDHVHAALLWNSRLAAAFNWLWVDGTTYAAYDTETRNVAPIITCCKQSATKRGATTVLSTLVSSAREVFNVLATQQLQDPSAPGIGFPALLRTVRERFILNSEHALKSVLAEFRDHELIKLRPGPDGGEVMYVPMEPDVLRGALQELQQAQEAS